MNNWLVEKENEAALGQICVQILSERAPEELPLFEEIFPQYVAISVEGPIETGTTTDDPFSFSGESELVLMVLLPMAGVLLSALLIHFGVSRVAELRHLSEKELDQAVDKLYEQTTSKNSMVSDIINSLGRTE